MKSFLNWLNESKQTLNETFNIVTLDSVVNTENIKQSEYWFYGSLESTIDKDNLKFKKPITALYPLYLASSSDYCASISTSTSKELKSDEPQMLTLVKINPAAKIMDLTKVDDYLESFIDPRTEIHYNLGTNLYKAFAKMDPYYSFSSSKQTSNIALSEKNYKLASYYFRFLNEPHFDNKIKNIAKTPFTFTKSLPNILFKTEKSKLKFTPITTQSQYTEFLNVFNARKNDKITAEFDNTITNEQMDIVNSYLITFNTLKNLYDDNCIQVKYKNNKTDPTPGAFIYIVIGDEEISGTQISKSLDFLQVCLFYIISFKYDGIYCQEIDRFKKETAEIIKVPTIAIFNEKMVEPIFTVNKEIFNKIISTIRSYDPAKDRFSLSTTHHLNKFLKYIEIFKNCKKVCQKLMDMINATNLPFNTENLEHSTIPTQASVFSEILYQYYHNNGANKHNKINLNLFKAYENAINEI